MVIGDYDTLTLVGMRKLELPHLYGVAFLLKAHWQWLIDIGSLFLMVLINSYRSTSRENYAIKILALYGYLWTAHRNWLMLNLQTIFTKLLLSLSAWHYYWMSHYHTIFVRIILRYTTCYFRNKTCCFRNLRYCNHKILQLYVPKWWSY